MSPDAGAVSDAVRIDRIARLEKIKSAAAALQMAETVRFAQSQRRRSWPPMCIRTRLAAG
jgi:hypothetical protein